MFGWRKRIGVISPTVIELQAYDFYKVAPEGVGMVGITCNIDDWKKTEFDKALEMVARGAEYLASRRVDFVIHAGVPLVVSRHQGYDQELIELIQSRSRVPATTSIRAAIDAMRHLGLNRIAIATPYPQEVTDNVVRYLTASGIEVLHALSTGVAFKELQDVHPHDIYKVADRVLRDAPKAEAIYLPCPQWPSQDVVAAMESDFGRPALAHDTVEYWAAFSALGIRDRIEGYGTLLESLSSRPH